MKTITAHTNFGNAERNRARFAAGAVRPSSVCAGNRTHVATSAMQATYAIDLCMISTISTRGDVKWGPGGLERGNP